MAIAREWTRRATRATGVSLVAPLLLFTAGGVVASGGGVGGIGAVGQLAGGPALPDTGVPATASASLRGADVVGADTSEPAATTAAPAAGARGPSAPSSSGDAGGDPAGDGVAVSPLPRPPTPSPSSKPAPGGPIADTPSPAGGAPPSAGPVVKDLIEGTRGLGESLPGPLGPTTGDILDLLPPRGSP